MTVEAFRKRGKIWNGSPLFVKIGKYFFHQAWDSAVSAVFGKTWDIAYAAHWKFFSVNHEGVLIDHDCACKSFIDKVAINVCIFKTWDKIDVFCNVIGLIEGVFDNASCFLKIDVVFWNSWHREFLRSKNRCFVQYNTKNYELKLK